MSKKAEAQAATPAGGSGQYPRRAGRGVEALSGYGDGTKSGALMEAVVERATMWEAYRRVICNKGSAGVDGMTCAELKESTCKVTVFPTLSSPARWEGSDQMSSSGSTAASWNRVM